jgi:hypothetical protein
LPIAAGRLVDRQQHFLGFLESLVEAIVTTDAVIQKYPNLLARCPIDDLREGWNACSGKSRIEAGSGIEAADLLESEIGGEAVAVGGAAERAVVKHDRLAFSIVVAPQALAAANAAKVFSG